MEQIQHALVKKAGKMTLTKRYIFFFSLTFLLAGYKANAQEINGDTIYVDEKAEVAIKFPSMPTDRYTVPTDAPYNFITLGEGFTIKAKKKNTKPATLFVIEGKRTHRFFIVFKKNIDYNNLSEIEYDYSTTKKLKDHIKQVEEKEKKYMDAITAADKFYLEKDYVNAKSQYSIALDIFNRPWPKDQLKKCNKKIRRSG
jgi:hypothetical protein